MRLVRTPLFGLDPGWLWLVAGLSLLTACMLVPAIDDLRQAEHRRDHARALEAHAAESLNRHLTERDALDHPSDRLILSLAASHLNLAPANSITVLPEGAIAQSPADPFEGLTPEFTPPEPEPAPDSMLQRLLTDRSARVWVAAFALLCIFYGLLPATTAPTTRDDTDDEEGESEDWDGAEASDEFDDEPTETIGDDEWEEEEDEDEDLEADDDDSEDADDDGSEEEEEWEEEDGYEEEDEDDEWDDEPDEDEEEEEDEEDEDSLYS